MWVCVKSKNLLSKFIPKNKMKYCRRATKENDSHEKYHTNVYVIVLYNIHDTRNREHIFHFCCVCERERAIFYISKYISVCSNLTLNVCYKFFVILICDRFLLYVYVYCSLFIVNFSFWKCMSNISSDSFVHNFFLRK